MSSESHHWARTAVWALITIVGIWWIGGKVSVGAASATTAAVAAINSQGAAIVAELQPAVATAAAYGDLARVAQVQVAALDVAEINKAMAAASGTAAAISATVDPIRRSAEQVNAALPDFLDCGVDATGISNKTCLYYRYADLFRSADITLQAVAQSAPAIAASARETSAAVANAAPSIAGSVAGIAISADHIGQTSDRALVELTKPKTFRQKVESWVKFGVYAASRFL